MTRCLSLIQQDVRSLLARSAALACALATLGLPATSQDVDYATAQAFEDWRMSCTDNRADNCRVWQRVQVAHDEVLQDVMSVSVAPADEGLALLFQVPLDVFLPADFGLRVDGAGERRVRYRNCNSAGCWVLMRGDSGVLGSFRRGITAEAALSLVEGETVRISFSLRGFTAAMAAFDDARQTLD